MLGVQAHLDPGAGQRRHDAPYVSEAGPNLVAHPGAVLDDELCVLRALLQNKGQARNRLLEDCLQSGTLVAARVEDDPLSADHGCHVQIVDKGGTRAVEVLRLGAAQVHEVDAVKEIRAHVRLLRLLPEGPDVLLGRRPEAPALGAGGENLHALRPDLHGAVNRLFDASRG